MAFKLATERSVPTTDYGKMNVAIVGAPGTGKTTFANSLDIGGPVYIMDTEGGTKCLSVLASQILSWEDFKEGVEALIKSKAYKHIVIDVVDDLHKLCTEYVCKINKVEGIHLLPFGSGYTAVNNFLFAEFKKINAAGMGLSFVTHERIKEVKKDAVTWSVVATSLGDKFEEMLTGKCDLVLYCYKDKDNKHMVRTKSNKWVKCAKDRTAKLPEVMPMDAKLLIKELSK